MTYGIPTLMEFSDVEILTRFCADNGFSFVEMNLTFPWFQSDVIDADTLSRLKRKYGVNFTIHMHDQFNPFEFSPEMRRAHWENALYAIELACKLDIPKLNMHLLPGTYSSINGTKTYLYAQYLDRYLGYVREFRDFTDQKLKGQDTVFCIENTSGYLPFHHKAIELMLESRHFGLTFDIGHDYKTGNKDEAFILAHRDRLCHFHIHDCSSRANHLGFGEGCIDLPRFLLLAKDLNASVVAEVKESGGLIRSKEYMIEHNCWQSAH